MKVRYINSYLYLFLYLLGAFGVIILVPDSSYIEDPVEYTLNMFSTKLTRYSTNFLNPPTISCIQTWNPVGFGSNPADSLVQILLQEISLMR